MNTAFKSLEVEYSSIPEAALPVPYSLSKDLNVLL